MANIVVRQLGPLVAAASRFKQSLYRPPQSTIDGVSEELWPNPLQPVTPMGPPNAQPLQWPFNYGRNLIFTPREDAEYSAAQLRRFAQYPLARICIENNKDMLLRMPWKVQLKPRAGETSKAHADRSKNDPKLKTLNDFLAKPNPQQSYEEVFRPVLEDMLVIDAPAIYVGRDKKGKPVELRWIDGSSITRLVDQHGWTPAPPNPAYQQLWEGYPRLDLTTDQLIYKPRNIVPRNTQASFMYGFSPTEQVAFEIQIGQARLQYVYDFYKEGSVPGGILFAPIGTPPDKIKEAQQWLDSDLVGQLAKRRRLQILQGFQQDGKSEQLHFPTEPTLADLFDDVHMRKICFAYGTSPNRLAKQMNRASADATQSAAEEEGTLPWLFWLKGLLDYIIQVILEETDYEVMFDPFQEMDRLKQSMADAKDIEIGLYTRNEKRRDRGDDPRPEKEADELNIMTANAVVGLDFKPPPPGGAGGATSGPSAAATTTRSRTGSSAGTNAGSGATGHAKACPTHSNSYPRTHCEDCIKAEYARLEKSNGFAPAEI